MELSEGEQQSRVLEQELREYLQRDAFSASLADLLKGVVARGSGSYGGTVRDQRGLECHPYSKKPTFPPNTGTTPWMPVPMVDSETGPMEWFMEGELLEAESMGVPTMVV